MALLRLRNVAAALVASWALTFAAGTEAAPRVRVELTAGVAKTGGGVYTAGEQGAEYAIPGGGRLKVAPGSVFRIYQSPQDLMLGPSVKVKSWSVLVRSGRIDVELPEGKGGPKTAMLFSVANKVNAIVASGRATVLSDSTGTLVANYSGTTLAGPDGKYKPLEAGAQRAFSKASPDGDTSALIATPTFQPGRRMWLASGGSADLDRATWRAVPDAVSYEVWLTQANGEVVGKQRTTQPALAQPFSALSPGKYLMQIASVDARGLTSLPSPPTTFQILGIELPPGAYVSADGAVHLAPGQRAVLSDTSELEMAHSKKTRFIPAPKTLGLYRNESTTLWLRVKGSSEAQTVRLEPRRLIADVVVGPKRAIWPRDSVQIAIQLRDTTGKPVPSWVKVKPTVTLGIDPLELSWQRSGDMLRATVPAPAGEGPWVVRVEVADQFGIPLGYDFLEVIGLPKPDKTKIREVARR